MIDEQSLSADVSVPGFVVAALKQEILVRDSGVNPVVGPVPVYRLNFVRPVGEHHRFAESEAFPVNGIVVGRRVSVVVHVSAVHQSCRSPQRFRLPSAERIISVVEIRKPEGVAVFVTKCADSGEDIFPCHGISTAVFNDFRRQF